MLKHAENNESVCRTGKRPIGNKRAKLEAEREKDRFKLLAQQKRHSESLTRALQEQTNVMKEGNNITLFASMPDCPAKSRFFELQSQIALRRLEKELDEFDSHRSGTSGNNPEQGRSQEG
jgi:hypothetical protein